MTQTANEIEKKLDAAVADYRKTLKDELKRIEAYRARLAERLKALKG